MIQHDALPADPDHGEVFDVPEELQLGIAAYIRLYQDTKHVGEATSLEKITHTAHAWELSRVIFFGEVDFKREVLIKTILVSAAKLKYVSGVGWLPYEYRDKPLQETKYVGVLGAYSMRLREPAADSNVCVYDHVGFTAHKKGETL
jgi:hypothetical protein